MVTYKNRYQAKKHAVGKAAARMMYDEAFERSEHNA